MLCALCETSVEQSAETWPCLFVASTFRFIWGHLKTWHNLEHNSPFGVGKYYIIILFKNV